MTPAEQARAAFSARLAEVYARSGSDLAALAETVGIDVPTALRIVLGKTKRLDVLWLPGLGRWARDRGVNPDWLLTGFIPEIIPPPTPEAK